MNPDAQDPRSREDVEELVRAVHRQVATSAKDDRVTVQRGWVLVWLS